MSVPNFVHLVVPAYNRISYTQQLLDSLSLLDLTNITLSLTITDDGSDPPLEEALEIPSSRPWSIRFLRNSTPIGPARCRNLATGYHRHGYVWFLDNDSEIVNGGCLVSMISLLQSLPDIGGTGGVMEHLDDEIVTIEWVEIFNFLHAAKPLSVSNYQQTYVHHIASSNLFMSYDWLNRLGGFNESFDRDEDKYLCCQLRQRGLRFVQTADTLAMHHFDAADRGEGFFSHFKDSRQFYKTLLTSRVDFLLELSKLKLLFLPLLDIIFVPLLLHKISSGQYLPSRFSRLRNETSSISVGSFGYILYLFISSYSVGYGKLILHLKNVLLKKT